MSQPRTEICDICSQDFKKIENLNKHMANIHEETPHMRMNRLTTTFQSMVNQSKIQNVKSAKLFDCSECGNMFSSYSEQKSHNDEYHAKTRHRTTEAPYYSKYQEDAVFEALTMEEREELETLHHEEMEPTQEEEDWMLLIAIKEERSALAKMYLPVLLDYKVKGICDMCKRYFYKNGSLEEHIKKNHIEEKSHQKIQVIPQEVWLSKSLPNLEDLLATVPSHILVSKEEELESKKDFEDIMFDLKKVKVQTSETKKSTYICDQCKFNTFF